MKGPVQSARVWRWAGLSLVFYPYRFKVACLLLTGLCFLGLLALYQGRTELGFWALLQLLFHPDGDGVHQQVVWQIRLPRVLTAVLVGAALGVSGAVFQSLSRNPLGSPDIIGFTTGAATGAIAHLVLLGHSSLGVMFSAVIGGLLTSLVVMLLARHRGIVGSYRLVLVGIGVGSILSALNGLMLVKGDLDSAIIANLWLAGSLSGRSWMHVWPVFLGCCLCFPPIMLLSRQLNLMEISDDLACQLGIHVERVRQLMMLLAVILAALATGAAGPIAFIALAAPQLVTRLMRSAHLPLMGSALMGACLLVSADLLTHVFPAGVSLPLGRMTGVVGGLYLLWLLSRSPRRS